MKGFIKDCMNAFANVLRILMDSFVKLDLCVWMGLGISHAKMVEFQQEFLGNVDVNVKKVTPVTTVKQTANA